MRQAIDAFWTGGWDSSYRVIQAALVEQRDVRPHYIIDPVRRSSLHELQAISTIRSALRRLDPAAADRIQELRITPIMEIPEDTRIMAAYRGMRASAYLGGQYVWLANYAQSRGLERLELSVHVDDKAYHFLRGKVEETDEGIWQLSDDVVGHERELFSRFTFPLLTLSKLQMREQASRHGFLEVLENAWFCYHPLGGRPCGVCNPCQFTMEEGLSYRLPWQGRLRYRLRFLRQVLQAQRALVRKGRRVLAR
ncbi:7-cyano-7-deazaguanine synthase [Halomonas maura]|uniref:7-cyano-7-deazaguanine synthase n=1 Tax=Halomonas maura TaxID=117606 RepID=UPI0025B3F550|nr:7-cyano-7-deazaguanine synthase [Halomonas maura]MDN3555012.1 7-cyano-7-deazaguanine synthase [Halomonas maura]